MSQLTSTWDGFWKETHEVPHAAAIAVSCFAVLFNLDDLVGALRRLGQPGSLVDLLRLVLCAVAIGIVCWFPKVGALLVWVSIPVSVASSNIALLILAGPIVCIVVTATTTLAFAAVNAAILVLGVIAVGLRWVQWSHSSSPILWTGAFLLVASTALGLVLRAVLNARSERRRQERRIADVQRQAEEAAERERQRLAHDMHDYVAHELTVIVAALAAARARRDACQQSAEQDVELMGTVEQTSRKALDELRRVLRLLDDGASGEPIVGSPMPVSGARPLEPVSTLIAEAAQDLRVIGDDVGISIGPDVAELAPAGEQRALLQRFLSEAVTNAAKHGGPGSHVTIRASTLADGWQVSLRNTIEKGAAGPDESTGLGIRGLRERAEDLHCEVSAGPVDDRHGWTMTLTVPESASV